MQTPRYGREPTAPNDTVLFVGENSDSAARALAELGRWGDPAVAATAYDALDHLERGDVSCVVSAATLPHVDVLAFIDAIRELSADLPVVVSSETDDEDLAKRVLAYDETEFVHWDGAAHRPKQVARRIENAVARYRSKRTVNQVTASFDALVRDVTERKRVEDELKREAEFAQSALNALPDIFFTLDLEGRLVRWNEQLSSVTGYDDDELSLRHPAELFADEDAGRVADAIQRVYLHDEVRVEASIETKDGREIPYEFTGALLEDDRGRELGIAGIGRDITERKRRETELEASREKYQRLVETAPDAVFVVDAETGRIIDTNAAGERLLGKSRDEIVGMHQSELHPPAEADRYRQIFEEHVESGEVRRDADDYYVVHDDGHHIPVEISAGITEVDGRTVNQAVFRDVTDRKRHEEILETFREVTRDLMAAETRREICELTVSTAQSILELPITGIHLFDEDRRTLRPVATTAEAERLFDGVPDFDEGEGLAWRVYEDGVPTFYDDVRTHDDVYNEETPVQTEIILPLGDHGVLTSGSTESETLTEAKLNLVKILAANAEAALDRADRERTIERQRDQLQAELDEVFERIDDGFFALDDAWAFNYVNERAERLLETSESTLLGRTVWDTFPEGRRSEAYDAFHRAVDTQTRVTCEEYFESLEAWLEFHVYPSESGLSVYFRDVSDRKRREEQLKQQNERLESFASMLAHELRNPLSIAQIYLQQAAEGDGDEASFAEVETALDRMEKMIDILLVMTRGGDSAVDPEPVSLRDMAAEAWSNLSADRDRCRVEDDVVVRAEPHHLQHLVENLFQNALEHGDDVTVCVGALDGATDGFYVEDDGPGVPEAERESVFEAGYTTDENGIGLGLTFVTQLAELYEWECELTESDAGGARFEFENVDTSSGT